MNAYASTAVNLLFLNSRSAFGSLMYELSKYILLQIYQFIQKLWFQHIYIIFFTLQYKTATKYVTFRFINISQLHYKLLQVFTKHYT